MWFLPACAVLLLSIISAGDARLLGIPTVPFEASSSSAEYSLKDLYAIVVDSRFRNVVDENGQTLIPPTLASFGNTFRDDLASVGVNIPLLVAPVATQHAILLTLGDIEDFRDAAGRPTSEGYSLTVTESGLTIAGASPLGAFWGTRTVLQQAVLGNLRVPIGSGVDAPGWGSRGIMIDMGRHYYPPDFVVEMCSYLSFFKQNVFHLHLSDHLWDPNYLYTQERSLELYAAFRPNSDGSAVDGLSRPSNETFSRNDLETMQQKCASRGVTIIPELEAPGHALAITQWNPELALGDFSMLNISYPGTIPTMKTIWQTFLPWFHSKTVHIGADEYASNLVADYNGYVNDLNTFIYEDAQKTVRIWGTFPPSTAQDATNVNTSVQIQHWSQTQDNAYPDFIQNGYNVLNADDFFYLDSKYSDSYPPSIDLNRVFFGNPDGGPYAPYIFDAANATNNPQRDSPYVLGQMATLWNDWGPNASTYLEAYYMFRDGLPALADKQWGGDLLLDEYQQIFPKLQPSVPDQNLDRRIPSKSDTILEYTFSGFSGYSQTVTDSSGNDYHGTMLGAGCTFSNSILYLSGECYIATPLGSKGRDYSLSFSVMSTSSHPGTLFSGPDSALLSGNGTSRSIMLVSGNIAYPVNYSLPLNTWSDIVLQGKGNQTFLLILGGDGQVEQTEEFTINMGIWGSGMQEGPMAIEAPLARIGEGFNGQMKGVKLVGSA